MQRDQVIQIQTNDVDAIFQRLDPSPLAGRCISRETDAYVVDRVRDMPGDWPVTLHVVLPASEAACCADVQEAFRAHYAASAARERRALRRHFREAGTMLLKGAIFAVILITIAKVIASLSDSLLMEKIAGGLSLIVWVSLWRPVDMLIYEWRPIMNRAQLLDRLARSDVRCTTSA
ncbi:MAG: hypothetical protein KF768_12395 [Phycisphaeraceae bacterium]|nr:hypothetical protein [Phycisphaeraceae bacterium]